MVERRPVIPPWIIWVLEGAMRGAERHGAWTPANDIWKVLFKLKLMATDYERLQHDDRDAMVARGNWD